MHETKLWKRITAVFMALVMTFVFSGVRGDAAEKSVKYIKQFKLFIQKDGTQADAEKWCKTQSDGDWHAVEGDLNEETDGTFSSKVGVFLCYCTTENKKEAVRDIAVMNEKGNYSESEYKMILEKQKQEYKDLVNDLKTQIQGYQENLKKKVKTALEAYDFLNGFKDDDSGKLLGDILKEYNPEQEKDEEMLTNILLQGNGQVVLFIQQQLTLACESGTKSWLDRMEQLGGYDKLYNKFKKAYNGDAGKAKKNLDKNYKEKAVVIADAWDQLQQDFNEIKKYEKKCGVGTMDAEQIKVWRENNLKTPEGVNYEQKAVCADYLRMYKYEGKSLLEFFMQDKSEISGNNLYKLYPIVSCLQSGQYAGLDSSVSLLSLISQAMSASLMNDYDKGKLADITNAAGEDSTKEVEEAKELVGKNIDQATKGEARSIYEGVDREVFKGGVAVTSDTLDYSNGSEIKWTDTFVDNNIKIHGYGAICYLVTLATACSCYGISESIVSKLADNIVKDLQNGVSTHVFSKDVAKKLGSMNYKSVMYSLEEVMEDGGEKAAKVADKAMDELTKAVHAEDMTSKILYGLSMGLTVALVLVAVADIVLNVIALYNYYHRDHLPIPHHMVDMAKNEKDETSYTNYKSVKDNSDGLGDLNGGSSKQWLALYQTYDEDAGDPILAPENGEDFKIIVQHKTSEEPKTKGYSPLHLFGAPNTAQNLTYADGEKGWSYRDGKNGTYLFFRRGEADVSDKSNAASGSAVSGSSVDIGTSSGSSVIVLFSIFSGVAGIFIGAIGMELIRRKKKVTGGSDS